MGNQAGQVTQPQQGATAASTGAINEQEIVAVQDIIRKLTAAYQQNILGQLEFINSIIISLLCEGHLLVESVPGLAKTRAVRVVAKVLNARFHRVQFTPDLLPSDIVGTQIYNQNTGEFKTEFGPIFTNLLLADEINRAPAKVQSAMLEAMAERQLSIAGETFELPRPFIVMATQNPIEQEGTYELPEAQLDRFFMKHVMTYPTPAEEVQMLTLLQQSDDLNVAGTMQVEPDQIIQAQQLVGRVNVTDTLKGYITTIVAATRAPQNYGLADLASIIRLPLSPRATIGLMYASRAQAIIAGRNYATPEDVKQVAHRVLRHRVGIMFDAELSGVTSDSVIDRILQTLPAP